ncbi:TetR family transcriptional regulator [Marinobacterium sediminicola]|uniref:Transcriptional regulator, TetR family n=1 Tax=Marinobacterium sediminicola TaxID=518898 RepID=A0ABY1RZ94_9GAMM|nr:TetR family transcriptional regulator [Marinobacterium sediminicola]ULG69160.1 TetR family transcriptional regulator [Marinobacterium sediminicola]SMR73558.1 transcriptional regulator, TetR family [Marinobacterium sediminicola]
MARRTPEEAAQTRQQLIETGLQLFSRQGIENTTLKQVAQAAGVTHGALYWHFRNRADLLLQIHHAYELPFEAQYLEQRQGAQQDALAALRQYVMGVLAEFARLPAAGAIYKIFYMAATPVADLAEVEPELSDNRTLWQDQLKFFLKQARKQKQLRKNSSPAALAFCLQAALSGLLQEWLKSEGRFDLQAEGQMLIDILLAGLPHK